jgi:hypothetical protein
MSLQIHDLYEKDILPAFWSLADHRMAAGVAALSAR